MENKSDLSIRKDLGYVSEINSCDSGHELVILQDKMISKSDNLNDEVTVEKLQEELEKTKKVLHQKTIECEKLTIIRDKVEAELEDLTTSLFEEANKMVYEANLKHDRAEKKLAVAEGNIDALETEVAALKSIVITSTPSNPNPNSHPQLIKKTEGSPIRAKILKNNTPDHFKTESKNVEEFRVEKLNESRCSFTYLRLTKEIDEVFFNFLKRWHQDLFKSAAASNDSSSFCGCGRTVNSGESSPLDECPVIADSEFLSRIFKEDISPCISFANEDLAKRVSSCIHKNILSVECTNGSAIDSKQICSLSKTKFPCKYRIRFSDGDSWFNISQSSRNRIISVCNFFTYLRYIRQGIVKHTVDQIYWEVINHRLEMSFATLGYNKEQI